MTMTPRTLVIAFAASVIAVVAGWFGGAAARDVWGDQYETAIGVVNANPGIPIESATPTPTPTPAETPTPTPTSSPSPSPTLTPLLTDGRGFCSGPPPQAGCECELEDGDWVWRCELPSPTEFDGD